MICRWIPWKMTGRRDGMTGLEAPPCHHEAYSAALITWIEATLTRHQGQFIELLQPARSRHCTIDKRYAPRSMPDLPEGIEHA